MPNGEQVTPVDLEAARKVAAEARALTERGCTQSYADARADVPGVPALSALVEQMAEEIERLRNPNLLRNLEQWDILPGGTCEPAFLDRMHAISHALGEVQKMKEEIERMRPVYQAAVEYHRVKFDGSASGTSKAHAAMLLNKATHRANGGT